MAFVSEECGAVTVDWVVLTAALVGLGLATMAVVSSGVEDLSTDVQTQLTDMRINPSFQSFDEQLVASYDRGGCADGMEGARSFADAFWSLSDPSTYDGDYDVGEFDEIVAAHSGRNDTGLQSEYQAWQNSYENAPEAFNLDETNDIEYSIVACLAAERGLT